MEKYQYEPLDDKTQEIRLLHIEKAMSGAVRCHLFKVGLHFAPAFEAIFYTWDNQEPDNLLIVVARNAQQIVYDHAIRSRPRWIWIDAICSYPDRTGTKHLRNLRLRPQSFEGFRFTDLALRIGNICYPFVYSK
jgi:hypothetical protein